MENLRGFPSGLPDIDAGQYLIDAMFVMRPTRSNGMCEVAADWDIIDAFARASRRISEPWEAETLFAMCEAYRQGREAGVNPLAIAPVDQDNPG